MTRPLARCANCGKSTRYCASKGCHPAETKRPLVWVGMCETPHGTAFVIDADELVAQIKLWHTWSESVYPGYASEHGVRNYATLHEWNGATVRQLELGTYGIWEKL